MFIYYILVYIKLYVYIYSYISMYILLYNRKDKQQEKANQSTKANKHKDSESLQNSIKRRTVHNHRINTHSHQNKRNGRIIQNSQRKQTQELTN